jgi:pyruvate dehydrogenase complex dehydrogenase (E1) component
MKMVIHSCLPQQIQRFISYDPAFAYELGHIVKDGLRRMYGENSENACTTAT